MLPPVKSVPPLTFTIPVKLEVAQTNRLLRSRHRTVTVSVQSLLPLPRDLAMEFPAPVVRSRTQANVVDAGVDVPQGHDTEAGVAVSVAVEPLNVAETAYDPPAAQFWVPGLANAVLLNTAVAPAATAPPAASFFNASRLSTAAASSEVIQTLPEDRSHGPLGSSEIGSG